MEPKAIAGAQFTAALSGESVYEDLFGWEWLDVDAMTLEIGGVLGIGGSVSFTIPFLEFDF